MLSFVFAISTKSKDYVKHHVPRYLQQYVQLGTMTNNRSSPLTDVELTPNVAEFADRSGFVIYIEILPVLVTDKIESIKKQLKLYPRFANVELKSLENSIGLMDQQTSDLLWKYLSDSLSDIQSQQQDDNTLTDYAIQSESTLMMTLRFK
ncbi:unnamed protein product [Adineta ricciae]|uniref:Uncharacterized protein n=1 Tax=Adineta ricciae TaxID=249248 RepID=A0A814UFD0_ADIRI|nr:unnamed protein product [Adineta ricciae]CAF1487563.1 unnamed protein product [Adineta ricciae]